MQSKNTLKIKILEYKFLFEEFNQVQLEYQQGAQDLNWRLSFFHEKIKKESQTQLDKFTKTFVGDSQPAANQENNEKKEIATDTEPSIQKVIEPHEKWSKKLYKQIISITHPDKTSGIVSKHIVNKFTMLYIYAVESFNLRDYAQLIMLGAELELNIPEDKIKKHVIPEIKEKQNKIVNIKKNLGYKWYHIPEEKRQIAFENYLQQLGFTINKDKISEVMQKRRPVARKPGTKPKSMREKRNSLKQP